MCEAARKGALGLAGAMAVLLGSAAPTGTAGPAASAEGLRSCPLAGSWTLVAADRELPDGTRVPDYGATPAGRLVIDAVCRYSLQIFKRERPAFASEDKAKGTNAEFREAVLGSSTHFGSIEADTPAGVLVFKIEESSFPNWRGTEQRRTYTLAGDILTYRVPRRPDGSIPISVWRRLP